MIVKLNWILSWCLLVFFVGLWIALDFFPLLLLPIGIIALSMWCENDYAWGEPGLGDAIPKILILIVIILLFIMDW